MILGWRNIPSELTHETPDSRVAAFSRECRERERVFLNVMTVGEIKPVLQRAPLLADRVTILM
jgi:hypothetical protein